MGNDLELPCLVTHDERPLEAHALCAPDGDWVVLLDAAEFVRTRSEQQQREHDRALALLGKSFSIDESFRRLAPDEEDFEAIRDDPGFRRLVEGDQR